MVAPASSSFLTCGHVLSGGFGPGVHQFIFLFALFVH